MAMAMAMAMEKHFYLIDAAPVRRVLKDRPILMMLLELFKCE